MLPYVSKFVQNLYKIAEHISIIQLLYRVTERIKSPIHGGGGQSWVSFDFF
jgi:hypothetical protein